MEEVEDAACEARRVHRSYVNNAFDEGLYPGAIGVGF